jgi:hypothetical protein
MNSLGTVFLLINSVMLFLLPRRWAPLPLLVGACYMTLGQGLELGPFHFMIIRILVAVGVARVIIRGERLVGEMNSLDWLMVVWAVWALISSVFHADTAGVLVNRLGLVYNACGIYFLLRIFCQSLDDVVALCRITAVLIVPLAIALLFEKTTGRNLFSVLGGLSELSEVRDGSIRAQGPFASSILAGTVGAVCLPLMVGLWQQYRKTAVVAMLACFSIIFASASSGPIMSAIFAIGALVMWHWRDRMRLVRWLAVFGYVGLDLMMKAPAYYLMARINLTGSSTGWHRAVLIDTAFTHLSEWWFAGTDYTRHWLDYGVVWSADHIDVTNHYLKMGIDGGLPLMFLFIAILGKGFSFVGQCLREGEKLPPEFRFLIWSFGASLFSHAVTCISVSYFDQSVVFMYLTLAVVGSIWSCDKLQIKEEFAQENKIHTTSAISISGH